jgi:hypothetical protein
LIPLFIYSALLGAGNGNQGCCCGYHGDNACGGAFKVIACIEDPVVIKKILDHLKEKLEQLEQNRHAIYRKGGRHLPERQRACSADTESVNPTVQLKLPRVEPRPGFVMSAGRNGSFCGEKVDGFLAMCVKFRTYSLLSNGTVRDITEVRLT